MVVSINQCIHWRCQCSSFIWCQRRSNNNHQLSVEAIELATTKFQPFAPDDWLHAGICWRCQQLVSHASTIDRILWLWWWMNFNELISYLQHCAHHRQVLIKRSIKVWSWQCEACFAATLAFSTIARTVQSAFETYAPIKLLALVLATSFAKRLKTCSTQTLVCRHVCDDD